MLDILGNPAIISNVPAGVAHPVERHLAKVEVASSSLVTRSINKKSPFGGFFFYLIRIRGSNHLYASLRWRFARRQLDGGDTIIFISLWK